MAYTTLNIQETVSADHDNDMQSLFNFQNQPLTQARFPKLFSIAHARVRQWVKDIDQLDLALLASRNFYVVPNLIPVAVAKALVVVGAVTVARTSVRALGVHAGRKGQR